MACYQKMLTFQTRAHNEITDITDHVRRAVTDSGIGNGQCTVYTPHATAAITINENDDPNVGVDLLAALRQLVPEHGGWLHDRVDNNAAAHIKSALIGPSETVPVNNGSLCLGTWQNIFLCEFDGPREQRKVVVSVVA